MWPMKFTHDLNADAAYIYITDDAVQRTAKVDEHRYVDYDEKGRAIGIELLGVQHGVLVTGLPLDAQFLAYFLSTKGIQARGVAPSLTGMSTIDAISASRVRPLRTSMPVLVQPTKIVPTNASSLEVQVAIA